MDSANGHGTPDCMKPGYQNITTEHINKYKVLLYKNYRKKQKYQKLARNLIWIE